ncbi:carbohydrate kinase [Aeromicrobium sp. 636]|uniref:Carbohydrate kinase n=1 Tax=Aeromicrobium senzhongii TaxID=2663859 RepID=A0A8I0EVL0_9ACTN|nr:MULTISPECIES: FGGY family carbohydrate kinase [Aeromicrobium]MBC9226964.1 carbohydrate kinase [Aeromicrobium senzhongii]MCQ3999064.1 carbohydrate kinase [Aeromicrobium sp. 636]
MILGVDIGTSVTKAALIGRDGRSVRSASRPSELLRGPGGVVEQDLDDVVASVVTVVRTVMDGTDEPIDAIALTGQGDGLWLRDEHGRPTRRAISWMDGRAADRVARWRSEGVLDRVHALTGSGVFPGSHAALLAHLAEHEPEVLERSAVAGYCIDAVLQRLTGVVSVDASDASLPFLDVRTRRYVEEALVACGVESWRRLLPEPAAPRAVFALDATGAQLLGLPEGLPVTAGPYDVMTCGIGAGARRPGQGTVVVGTTLSCEALTRDATIDPDSEPAGMWLCTPDPDLFLRTMPSMAGTAAIAHALSLVGAGTADLQGLLEQSAPGASGIRALPFVSGAGERAPFVEPRATGQILGMTLTHGPADLVRAMCESVAYAARHCLEAAGLDGELSGCGGGLGTPAFAQLIADATGQALHVPYEPFVGARGAAAVAWAALGTPVDEDAWAEDRQVITPQDDLRDRFEAGYAAYLADVREARQRWTA